MNPRLLGAFDRADDFRHVACPENGIDLGNLRAQLVAIALAQAAGDDQALAGARLLVLGELENRVDRLFLRRVDERARVHDQHVGLGRIRRQRVAALLREAHHHLGIDEVLRAAERDETNLHLDSIWKRHYGVTRYIMRGKASASRTCSRPQIQPTTRSMPMPNPPCGTDPYRRRSRYHSKASCGRLWSLMRCSRSS